jgi:hypothetical protein
MASEFHGIGPAVRFGLSEKPPRPVRRKRGGSFGYLYSPIFTSVYGLLPSRENTITPPPIWV